MQKIKYICDVQPNHFVVASIVCTHARAFTDTQESHFSFAVFGVEPEDFIKALEDMIQHRECHETYYQPKEVVLKATHKQVFTKVIVRMPPSQVSNAIFVALMQQKHLRRRT